MIFACFCGKCISRSTCLDGAVDGEDLSTWNLHRFQRCTRWVTADFNGDGVTDGSDFNLWSQHKFKATVAAGPTERHTCAPRVPLRISAQRVSPGAVDAVMRIDSAADPPDRTVTDIEVRFSEHNSTEPAYPPRVGALQTRHFKWNRYINSDYANSVHENAERAADLLLAQIVGLDDVLFGILPNANS